MNAARYAHALRHHQYLERHCQAARYGAEARAGKYSQKLKTASRTLETRKATADCASCSLPAKQKADLQASKSTERLGLGARVALRAALMRRMVVCWRHYCDQQSMRREQKERESDWMQGIQLYMREHSRHFRTISSCFHAWATLQGRAALLRGWSATWAKVLCGSMCSKWVRDSICYVLHG